jgi:hypothetical protein
MELFEQGVAAGFVKNRAESFIVPLVRRGDRVGAILVLRELRASPAVIARVLEAIERPAPVPTTEIDALARDVSSVARPGDQTISLTRLYLWLGQYDRISANSGEFLTFATPHWDTGLPGFRNSATFKKLLNGMGVPDYWRRKGFPPQCRAVGAKDFTCD